ncbi:beta-galactosidase GalB [Aquimarina sp. RZ0]|uniref:beta-galactosidase GalB n=1 Tax=Aquimarina sp. RZ0 TaxID=2607730 RepID=UPI0011F36301|nr:beta-galactosidase GalB [Aquimarina sp. RZ0]KAA1244767.1 DUF4982 domain-containing protein [Aquimarina sp. RZ0]
MNLIKSPIISILFWLLPLFTVCISCSKNIEKLPPVEDQNFNKKWLFSKGVIEGGETIGLDDSKWRSLNLPHDWAIEGPFDNKYNARTGGLPVHGTGWYRKHFTIDKKHQNQQISIEFDGAMNNAKVWLNGNYIGERPYGYIGFEFDLTPHIKFGEDNVIAVQLSPEDLAARWYTGAGIYRNVRLKINNSVHISQWGTYITTPEITDQKAIVSIKTKVKNVGTPSNVILETIIKDANGNVVDSTSSTVALTHGSEKSVAQTIEISNPKLWDIHTPYLYTTESNLKIDKNLIDSYKSTFGVRSIRFDANKGFFLNDTPVELNGVCMHHDQGALGAAISYRAKERQMQIMKSMGVNALRTSHNPPSPELLEVCDRLGIVVIVEAFDEWKKGKVPNGYNKYFDKWHEKDLRDMIKRDRNHPSVIMWSIGNEILEQAEKDGWILTKRLNDICHNEDNTRPTTIGFNYYPAPFVNKLAYQVDVVGINYHPANYAEIKEQNPEMIIYGSETSSQTSSRGEYQFPIQALHQKETGHVSSYDVNTGPVWAYPPDVEFDFQKQNPFSLGEFIWTGFDYLGEPTPYGGRDNSTDGYWNDDWPSKSSYFAPVDLCGFPKDRYYLYQSQWTSEPMVHVLPHWNWEGKEGDNIPIYSYTNCDEVELIVNGKSFGKKIKGVDTTKLPAEFHGFKKGMYTSKYRLSWNVPYQPGSIKVIGYKNGAAVVEKEIKTASAPARIKLIADRTEINADGEDLSFITIRIEDKSGNLCPRANNKIQFEISGAGVLAAVGNGDQTSLESFQANSRKAFNGLCQLIVRSQEKPGKITIKATADGLTTETIVLLSK